MEKRDVFLHQLFLQVLCSSGDDDAAIATESSRDCGNEISERLTGPRSSLDDQVSLLFKRSHHRLRHLDLARSIFIFRMRLRDQSLRTKYFKHGFTCDTLGH